MHLFTSPIFYLLVDTKTSPFGAYVHCNQYVIKRHFCRGLV
jgi:hypothetical protein